MKNDEPEQYKRGWVEFFKLKFKVTPDVLIPRPETELLVEKVIKINPKLVLDVGTGAGNIAISVAKNLKGVRVTATDVSEDAIKIAKQNAKLHGVEEKVEFIHADLLDVYSSSVARSLKAKSSLRRAGSNSKDALFVPDLIVTNLPYIPSERIEYLDASVKDFEPRVALDGGDDGFGLYRKLFEQMIQKKIIPSFFIGEIDYTHAEIAVTCALKYFPKARIEVEKDLAHMQRFLVIEF